jgi:hypothetical protein
MRYQVQSYDPFSRLWLRRRNYKTLESASLALAKLHSGQVIEVTRPSRPLVLRDRGQTFELVPAPSYRYR